MVAIRRVGDVRGPSLTTVGTTDSADFQGPIARPVSDDFRHFFTQIATEYSLRAGDSPYARSTRF